MLGSVHVLVSMADGEEISKGMFGLGADHFKESLRVTCVFPHINTHQEDPYSTSLRIPTAPPTQRNQRRRDMVSVHENDSDGGRMEL